MRLQPAHTENTSGTVAGHEGDVRGRMQRPGIDYRGERITAFRATVADRLGPGLGVCLVWNGRAVLPTLATDEPIRQLALRLGDDFATLLYDESHAVPLEACEDRWMPAMPALAAVPSDVPSVSEAVAAFNTHIRPMERAARGHRRLAASLRLGCTGVRGDSAGA